MSVPVYADGTVTLFCGDNLQVGAWLSADLLVTDPPYGGGWRQGNVKGARGNDSHPGIVGDDDTQARDRVLALWGDRPAIVFGRLGLPEPARCRQTLIYRKAPNAGLRGAMGGYLRNQVGQFDPPDDPGEPVDLMETLIANAGMPDAVIADPFAGSGSTLVAARNLGYSAVGVEIDPDHCRTAAARLAQGVLEVAP